MYHETEDKIKNSWIHALYRHFEWWEKHFQWIDRKYNGHTESIAHQTEPGHYFVVSHLHLLPILGIAWFVRFGHFASETPAKNPWASPLRPLCTVFSPLRTTWFVWLVPGKPLGLNSNYDIHSATRLIAIDPRTSLVPRPRPAFCRY